MLGPCPGSSSGLTPTSGEQEMRKQQLWPCAHFPLPFPCPPWPWVPLLGRFPRGLILMKAFTFPTGFSLGKLLVPQCSLLKDSFSTEDGKCCTDSGEAS